MTAVLGATQVWWHLARSSGLVAWALAALTVLWGLALSTRALGRRPKAPWLLDLHRFLGGLTVLFVGVHLLGLWADSYVQFDAADLFVPFASSWRPVAVAWGVIAFYFLLAVEVTSLLMKRLPKRWWRRIHLTSYLVYGLATVHLLTAGTDATSPAVYWVALASLAGVSFFSVYRWVGPGRQGTTGRIAGSPS
jgi:DMSO/TMAO reductase YedYZ heme-binding membrane subunit